jgi:hypothetical protein
MSDALFAFAMSLGAFCLLLGGGALVIVPRLEARERHRSSQAHPAE